MINRPEPVIEIFNEALKLEPSGRKGYLDRACSSDNELRQRVEGLLRAYEKAGEFLIEPVTVLRAGAAPKPPVGEAPGDHVSKYKLLQQIGEGGCGVVFMAEQEEPVRRRVALKVVKPGMDTRNVIARFESERQALALMEHPNIAQVLDAGATDAGRPYFVMELVRGAKITDYCDQNSLTTRARLELFVQVCHAIQHAHLKGIIHRDIKPSNILVTTTGEGTPLPKVIDFGIAKATTGQLLTDKTFFTAFEMLIGTPAYMSPEQAALTSADVDTRTDIYSLGVLLYELLTGTTPFDVRELSKVGLDEIRRVIINKYPIRPSTRLKIMQADDLTTTAQHRQVESLRLIRVVRGDLDWIAMKALEKDRSRRYETASALATDVQRYLAREPVAACPPTPLYKLNKLILRNRLLAGGLTTLGVLLISGLVIVSILLAREKRAKLQMEVEKRTAQVEATKSQQVTRFLSEMVAGVTPIVALGRDTTLLKDILDRASQRISSDLTNQPEVEAELSLTFSIVYQKLDADENSERMARRALQLYKGSSPQNTNQIATGLNRLGLVLLRQQKFEEADGQLQSSMELWRKLKQEEAREAVLTLENLAMLRWKQEKLDEAELHMRRVYSLRQKILPAGDADTIRALLNLGSVLYSANKLSEAEQLFRHVIETAPRHDGEDLSVIAQAFQNLGTTLSVRGEKEEAKGCFVRAIELRRKLFGRENPQLTASLNSLASVYQSIGNFAKAEPLYREVLDGREKPDDFRPAIITALRKLVFGMLAQRRTSEIDTLFTEILRPEISDTPKSRPVIQLRAEYLARTGRWREAAADAAQLVELQPAEHEHYHMLAPLLVADGQFEAYQKLRAEILTRFAGTTDIFIADRMAKDSLILPATAELSAVAAMADIVGRARADDPALPFFQVCKALAEYRQRHFAAAAEWAGKVDDSIPHAGVEAGAVLAMARYQLKQSGAREQLARTATTFATNLPRLESGDIEGDWRDWIIAHTLLAEARTLMESSEERDSTK